MRVTECGDRVKPLLVRHNEQDVRTIRGHLSELLMRRCRGGALPRSTACRVRAIWQKIIRAKNVQGRFLWRVLRKEESCQDHRRRTRADREWHQYLEGERETQSRHRSVIPAALHIDRQSRAAGPSSLRQRCGQTILRNEKD